MRYPKDSIQLSQSRYLPLLRQILRWEFVTHSQLVDFMRLNHCEHTRKSCDWRRRRLVDPELVRRKKSPGCAGELERGCVQSQISSERAARGKHDQSN
jgi:hypothetical protein